MNIWRGSFEDALELSKGTIRKYPFQLAATFVFSFFLNMAVESPFAAPQTVLDDQTRIISQMTLLLWSLIMGFLLFLMTAAAPVRAELLQNQQLPAWNKDTWVGLAAEPLRALMHIILWSLLLIIPGLVFYVLYSFVMHIVLFSKEYQAGNQDALKLSKDLVKPMFFKFVLVSLIVSFSASAIGMAPQIWDILRPVPSRGLFEFIAFLISIYGYSLMRILFHKSMIQHLGG